MPFDPISATAAYRAASQMAQSGAGAGAGDAAAGSASGGANFGAMLSDAMQGAVGTLKTGEAATAHGIAGGGEIVDVVNSVTAAELTLETVVAIRDKVISAYQDIMKMPI